MFPSTGHSASQPSASAVGSAPQVSKGGGSGSPGFPKRWPKNRDGIGDVDLPVVIGVTRVEAARDALLCTDRRRAEEVAQGADGVGDVDLPVGIGIPASEPDPWYPLDAQAGNARREETRRLPRAEVGPAAARP